MKSWHIWASIFAVLVFGFLFSRDALAENVWRNFQSPLIALRLDKNDAGLAYEIGNYYFGAGKYDLDMAEVAFKRVLEIDPKFALANYQLARIYFIKGQTELALEAINKELEYHPENLRSLYVRGLIYGFSDKLAEAEVDFRHFIEWSPSEWAGWNDLAWVLAKEEKYTEALKALQEAFEKLPEAPKNVWLQNSLGVAYLNLKNYKEAEEAFLRAKEIAKDMPLSEWYKAYPGNSRKSATKGFESFKAAVEANLTKARYLGGN
ncbi:MAG: tetratricopeptide repeat protein [bacterium]|nr:tetratricopeptide repeat protein [bacterium]